MKSPEDTPNKAYLYVGYTGISFKQLHEFVKEKFPDTPLENLTIDVAEIQIDCFDYDQYDPMDFENYIIIEKK